MKYTVKYLIDFIALVLLYAFVFFRKWKSKGKDILLTNTLQPLINGFRSADITDLITNTTSGMAGYILYIVFGPITSWVLARLRK